MTTASQVVCNYDDVDPISLESIKEMIAGGGSMFHVQQTQGVCAYDADAWLSHLTTAGRKRVHPATRVALSPYEVWACFLACQSAHVDTEPADPRIALCLSGRIEATRVDGVVSIRPESPLLNLSVRSMQLVPPGPSHGAAMYQRFALQYSLVDSRDSRQVAVGGPRLVRIDCPVGDRLVVM
jgi:hypothetical protein